MNALADLFRTKIGGPVSAMVVSHPAYLLGDLAGTRVVRWLNPGERVTVLGHPNATYVHVQTQSALPSEGYFPVRWLKAPPSIMHPFRIGADIGQPTPVTPVNAPVMVINRAAYLTADLAGTRTVRWMNVGERVSVLSHPNTTYTQIQTQSALPSQGYFRTEWLSPVTSPIFSPFLPPDGPLGSLPFSTPPTSPFFPPSPPLGASPFGIPPTTPTPPVPPGTPPPPVPPPPVQPPPTSTTPQPPTTTTPQPPTLPGSPPPVIIPIPGTTGPFPTPGPFQDQPLPPGSIVLPTPNGPIVVAPPTVTQPAPAPSPASDIVNWLPLFGGGALGAWLFYKERQPMAAALAAGAGLLTTGVLVSKKA